MRIIYLMILFAVSSVSFGAANNNHFANMPHNKIMELSIEGCKADAIATGDKKLESECEQYQRQSFKKLVEIYDKYHIATPSWSLCLSEAKTQYSYNYLVMLACMKVVQSICKEKGDYWENPRQCESSMKSGLWINNPRVYKPLNEVFK
jgi:hypothetical protein